MILHDKTFEKFGYHPNTLNKYSKKLVICTCDVCDTEITKTRESIGLRIACKNAECVKENTKRTCLEKYGTTSPCTAPEVIKKAKQTNLKKYGVENPFGNKDIQNKIKKTNLQKYGVENAGGSKEVIEIIKQANLKKYGVEWSFQAEEVKANIKKTMLKRYGVENPNKSKKIRRKTEKTNLKRYGVTTVLVLPSSRKRMLEVNLAKYGTAYPATKIHRIEKEVQQWLKTEGFEFMPDYTLCHPKEIDLVNHDLKLGIEYCGLHWHNEKSPQVRPKTYHYDKMKQCNEKGYKLITVFEDEWLEREVQCKNLLKLFLLKREVGEIRTIAKEEAVKFVNTYDLKGVSSRDFHWFGIYKDELVGVVSVTRRKSTIFLRFTIKAGYTVDKLDTIVNWAKDRYIIKTREDNRWPLVCSNLFIL
ncbi:putative N-acetyltransferase domain-containing protein [Gammaproteobacteria bacterium]